MPNFWEKRFLVYEFLLSVLLVAGIVCWAEKYNGISHIYEVVKDNRTAIYQAISAIFGSLLGFIIASQAIILGFSQSEKLSVVRESIHYRTIWDTFMSAIKFLAFATFIALVGLVFDRDMRPVSIILYLNIFAVIIASLRLGRCIWVTEKIVGLITK